MAAAGPPAGVDAAGVWAVMTAAAASREAEANNQSRRLHPPVLGAKEAVQLEAARGAAGLAVARAEVAWAAALAAEATAAATAEAQGAAVTVAATEVTARVEARAAAAVAKWPR